MKKPVVQQPAEKWFRLDETGRVVGIMEMDQATAEMNVGPGHTLRPFDPRVSFRDQRWNGKRWVSAKRAAADPPAAFMRATGYPSTGDQLGVLMKAMEAVIDQVIVPPAIAAEFADLNRQIKDVKAKFPLKK